MKKKKKEKLCFILPFLSIFLFIVYLSVSFYCFESEFSFSWNLFIHFVCIIYLYFFFLSVEVIFYLFCSLLPHDISPRTIAIFTGIHNYRIAQNMFLFLFVDFKIYNYIFPWINVLKVRISYLCLCKRWFIRSFNV